MSSDLPNWFASDGEANFRKYLPHLAQVPCRLLQIGAYTGDATLWMVENILRKEGSVLVDVDTWEGSDERAHHEMNWSSVENIYDVKTQKAREDRKVVKFKSTSDNFFKNNRQSYDFIYVDGDHTAYGVMKDATSAYECLKPGGIIAFDDYLWVGAKDPADRPQMAIDAFLSIYRKRVDLLHKQYQCWVRKVG